MNSSITRLTITPTIALSSLFFPVSLRSILLIRCLREFRIFLNSAAPIPRNERYHQFYAIFFLFQTTIISFTIFHTLN